MKEKVTDDYALDLNSWKPVALNCGGRGRLQVGQSSAWGMFVMFGRREVWDWNLHGMGNMDSVEAYFSCPR